MLKCVIIAQLGLAEDRATHLSEQVRENLLHRYNIFLLVRMICVS